MGGDPAHGPDRMDGIDRQRGDARAGERPVAGEAVQLDFAAIVGVDGDGFEEGEAEAGGDEQRDRGHERLARPGDASGWPGATSGHLETRLRPSGGAVNATEVTRGRVSVGPTEPECLLRGPASEPPAGHVP